MHRKRGQSLVGGEKKDNWDGDFSKKKATHRPYKSMSFTASEMAEKIEEQKVVITGHKKSHSNIVVQKKFQKKIRKEKKEEKSKIKISMTDACTQTAIDVATQTGDEEEIFRMLPKMVNVKDVKSSNASTSMSDVTDFFINSTVGIQTQTLGDDLELDMENLKLTNNFITDLDDLEAEIAKVTHKALTLQESLKWLQREKTSNLRPTRPVGVNDNSKCFLPVGAAVVPRIGTHTKINGKRTLSVPVVLSAPKQADISPTATITAPDLTKFTTLPESSVFNKFRRPMNAAGVDYIKRQSKSLNDLPELKITYLGGNRAVVEDPNAPKKNE